MNERENASLDGGLIERQISSVCLGAAAVTILSLVAQIFLIVILNQVAPLAAQQGWYTVAVSSIPCTLLPCRSPIFCFGLADRPLPRNAKSCRLVSCWGFWWFVLGSLCWEAGWEMPYKRLFPH